MSQHRQRISLHELTALRVDINGERVQSSLARSRKQASSAKVDARGNIVTARPFLKKARKHQLDSGDEGLELVGESPNAEEGRSRKKQKKEHYLPEFLPFLHPKHAPRSVDKSGDDLPSSDLLKVIHHFATCYYDERGMLTASARTAQTERRSKAKLKRNTAGQSVDNDHERDRSLESETMDHDLPQSIVDRTSIPQGSHRHPVLAASTDNKARPASPNEGIIAPENRIRDMHRAFDGSTLLLIGMILQSHLESRVTRPPLPASIWDDQIREDRTRIQKKSRRGRKRLKPIGDKVKVEDGVNAGPSVDSHEIGEDGDSDSREDAEREKEDTTSVTEETDDKQSVMEGKGSNDEGTDGEKDTV